MTADRYPRPFGKYVLLRPLARGGMGEIYLAAGGEIGGFEKLCVIKKVLTEKADPGRTGRFLDEAKVVVRLSHANLVTVFDAGVVEDEFYIAMEFVEGKNLREAWNRCAQKSSRFPVDVALFVVREVCRGLAYAHEHGNLGLVHRDVSPPNILLSYFGEVKLTDFGLARSVLKQEKTAPGIVYGRYAYLSPEQARGEEADARTDLYSVGIILWELLTGRQLFPVGSADPVTALSVVRAPNVKPPSTLAARVPASLDEVVMRALAPRRETRFQTADDMRRALSEELARLSPTTDAERASALLRELYGDVIEVERAERERLLRLELPKVRREPSAPVVTLMPPPSRAPAAAAGPATADGAASPSDAMVGKVIDGRYRITAVLGEGGMGTVYEAEHVEIGKKFAIKILHPLYSKQSELVERFRREARAASTIGHPNIVDVSDFGTTPDGLFYCVMERLDGIELGNVLADGGQLEPERAVGIAAQMCRALAAAHAVGIVHRDLKPENVFLVKRDGVADFVKVLDFGIAKGTAGESRRPRLTNPGLAMGTPEYMAPEQATGKTTDARSDVYAVGAILYEMLVGRAPFEGQSALEVLSKKATETPAPARTLRPDLPEGLERVIMRTLELDPDARPQTMTQLEEELVRSLERRAAARPAPAAPGTGSGRPVEDVLFELAVEGSSELAMTGTPPALPPPPSPPSRLTSADPAPVVIVDRTDLPGALRARPAPMPDEDPAAALPGAAGDALRARDVWLVIGGIILVGGGAFFAVLRPWRHGPVGPPPMAAAEAAPAAQPPPVDPVAADLAAADQAILRQHWLSPRSANVYDLLKRLGAEAPGDPRVQALRQRTIGTLEKKGQAALGARRFGEAEIAYRSLARIDPEVDRGKPLAHALGGEAELALAGGRREAAQKFARDAIALDENQPEARHVLARLSVSHATAGKRGKRRR